MVTASDEVVVVRAGFADALPLGRVFAAAYLDLAPSVWLHPDREWRAKVFPDYFQMMVEYAVGYGMAYTTVDQAGAALWLPSDALAMPAHEQRLLLTVGDDRIERFFLYEQILNSRHPDTRHESLMMMAVAPDRQCSGIGTAFLERHHWELDAQGVDGYLEAPNPRVVNYFAGRGWVPYGPPLVLSPTRDEAIEPVQMYPMIRLPDPAKMVRR